MLNHNLQYATRKAARALESMSEEWIQRELDIAVSNAEKNRSIKCPMPIQPTSSSKDTKCRSSPSMPKTTPAAKSKSTPKSVASSVDQKLALKIHHRKEFTTEQQPHALDSMKQSIDEISIMEETSIQEKIHSIIGEWSIVIKKAIFHEDLGLNQDIRSPELLIVL